MNFVETAPSRFIQLETFSSVKVVLCKWEKLFSLIGAKQEVLSAFVLVCFFAISVTDVFIQNFTWKIKRNTCLFSSQGYMYLGRNTVNYLDRFDAESKRTDAFVFN